MGHQVGHQTGIRYYPIDTSAASTYSLVATDIQRIKRFTAACVVTVPTEDTTSIPVGFQTRVKQNSESGSVVIKAAAGVTLHCAGFPITLGRGAELVITKDDTNEWTVTGDFLDPQNYNLWLWCDPSYGVSESGGVLTAWEPRVGVPTNNVVTGTPDVNADGTNLGQRSITFGATEAISVDMYEIAQAGYVSATVLSQYYVAAAPAAVESVCGLDGGSQRGLRLNITTGGLIQAQYTNSGGTDYDSDGPSGVGSAKWAAAIVGGVNFIDVSAHTTSGRSTPASRTGTITPNTFRVGGSNKWENDMVVEAGHQLVFGRELTLHETQLFGRYFEGVG